MHRWKFFFLAESFFFIIFCTFLRFLEFYLSWLMDVTDDQPVDVVLLETDVILGQQLANPSRTKANFPFLCKISSQKFTLINLQYNSEFFIHKLFLQILTKITETFFLFLFPLKKFFFSSSSFTLISNQFFDKISSKLHDIELHDNFDSRFIKFSAIFCHF